MTPPPGDLDNEIQAALDGVNLQDLGTTEDEATPRGRGKDNLWPGVVQGVTGDDVIIELGPRMQGVVSLREFEETPKVGDHHKFQMRGREDELYVLSLTGARELAAWNDLGPGSSVKARITGQNQGGLELKIGSHSAFMPSSQVSLDREEDISSYIGQTLVCEVIEIDRGRDRVVLSRRRVLEAERLEALGEAVGKFSTGMTLTGKVSRIEAFGAFIDIGNGIEGLCHVSNISRKRVEDVNDVLKKGQEVQVQILNIQEGGRRIGLGMKQLEPDPWDGAATKFPADRQVSGKVTRLMDFGAFVEIADGLEGLLHVSQLGRDRVNRASDVLSVGEEVTVRIVSVDPSAERISLSRLDSRGAVLGSEEAVDSDVIDQALSKPDSKGLSTNLGDLFKKAMKKND
tara:strand:+ start:2449 stop:3651 length:1203 start_codon:yes stop_codon:yes gene_type:complete